MLKSTCVLQNEIAADADDAEEAQLCGECR
jgi:hypothetical protein